MALLVPDNTYRTLSHPHSTQKSYHQPRRSQSQHQPRGPKHRSPSPGHLPFHLQDPNHPRLRRRRRPSTLSTHSYDVHSPVTKASPRDLNAFSPGVHASKSKSPNTHFLFPASPFSLTSSPSLSPSPWYRTPNSTSQTFNDWPTIPRRPKLHLSHSADLLDVTPTTSSPVHSRRDLASRKSLDFNDVDYYEEPYYKHPRSRSRCRLELPLDNDWYDSRSQGSMSTLSTLSHRAVIHPHSCLPLPAQGFDYLTPVRVRPPLRSHNSLRCKCTCSRCLL